MSPRTSIYVTPEKPVARLCSTFLERICHCVHHQPKTRHSHKHLFFSFPTTMASLLERMNISTDSVGPVRVKVNSTRSASVPYVRPIP